MIVLLVSLLVNPHGVKELKPVIIGRTGLGVWRCCMDGRHLHYIERIKLAKVIADQKAPDWIDDPKRKTEANEWSTAMFLKCREFCHTGFWWDDYSFFHGDRIELSKAAKANGFGLIFTESN